MWEVMLKKMKGDSMFPDLAGGDVMLKRKGVFMFIWDVMLKKDLAGVMSNMPLVLLPMLLPRLTLSTMLSRDVMLKRNVVIIFMFMLDVILKKTDLAGVMSSMLLVLLPML